MSDLFGSPDKKTVRTATVVCVTFVALMTILGGLGRCSYSPYIIEHYLGVADDLEKNTSQFTSLMSNTIIDTVTNKLSSSENPAGYSRTFSYTNVQATVPQTLIFYARNDQHIEIDVKSLCTFTALRVDARATCGGYAVYIDGKVAPGSMASFNDPERVKLTGSQLPNSPV